MAEGTGDRAQGAGGSRHLVAPELAPVLDMLPALDLSDELLALIRSGGGRDSALQRPPLSPEQQAVACEERFAPGLNGAPEVRVLVYRPPGAAGAARPAYLHIHGGGYILGEPELNDGSNRALAHELGCVVVSVDYRLAPETPFPGALEDCYAALRWLHGEAEALGVDRTRIAIGGESAGGGHAAALAVYARDRGEIPICLQVLDSPMLDDRTGSAADPNPHPYCGEFVWTPARNRFGWRALLGMEPGGPDTPPGAAPARVADLAGLPPAFIVVGALDLFMEENLEYARRLLRAGVPTELHVIPGAFHGFGAAGGDAPQVQAVLRLRREALARPFQPG
jgi:triacylglycerol lipase